MITYAQIYLYMSVAYKFGAEKKIRAIEMYKRRD